MKVFISLLNTENQIILLYKSSIIPRTGELILAPDSKEYEVIQVIHPILAINQLSKVYIKVKEL